MGQNSKTSISSILSQKLPFLKFVALVHKYGTGSWNDRRSLRVFVCFYSAIFKLTSAKFQIFAYNSRTVRFGCMKFWQQVEINELYVLPNFEAKDHVT